MKPTNPLYSITPDHYALRRWWCSLFGHTFDHHQRVTDYTLDEVHHIYCKTCYGVRREDGFCLADSDAVVQDINPKLNRTKVRMYQKGML